MFLVQADMMAMVYAKEWAEEWLAASDVLDVSTQAKAHKQKAPRFWRLLRFMHAVSQLNLVQLCCIQFIKHVMCAQCHCV